MTEAEEMAAKQIEQSVMAAQALSF